MNEKKMTFDTYCDNHDIKHFREAFFHHLRAKGIDGVLTEEELSQQFDEFLEGLLR